MESHGITLPQLTLFVYDLFNYLRSQLFIRPSQVFKVAHLRAHFVQLPLPSPMKRNTHIVPYLHGASDPPAILVV